MMSFPENIDHYLEQVGQVACEVESAVEEQLEFVAISCVRYKDGENFASWETKRCINDCCWSKNLLRFDYELGFFLS